MASFLTSKIIVALSFFLLLIGSSSSQLSLSYYSKSCPNVSDIVHTMVKAAVEKETRMGASLLRLIFHDCFVNGCDGSIFLDDTPEFVGEKGAASNYRSVRGFDVIDDIKSALENACPGVVSCADILAIAARDSTVMLGGPTWDVKLGRRDSRIASQLAANTSIPTPFANLSKLIDQFKDVGLNERDLVVLSGAHTIGETRCKIFRGHSYRAPNIDHAWKQVYHGICPFPDGPWENNTAALDYQTPYIFDNTYFKDLIELRALLHTDQQLYNNASTDSMVIEYSKNESLFRSDFAVSMVKMSDIKPLTGSSGEIRNNCRRIN